MSTPEEKGLRAGVNVAEKNENSAVAAIKIFRQTIKNKIQKIAFHEIY